MKKVYCCKECGSTNLRRDATISINDPADVSEEDVVECCECFYDGRHFAQVEVPDDFVLGDDVDLDIASDPKNEVIL